MMSGVSDASVTRSAAPNPFCQVMIATHPQPPTGTTASTYRSFARQYLPYYRGLAVVAPSAMIRRDLHQVIAIMKLEAGPTSNATLEKLVAKNQVTWARDWTLFTTAVVACARWAVNLL